MEYVKISSILQKVMCKTLNLKIIGIIHLDELDKVLVTILFIFMAISKKTLLVGTLLDRLLDPLLDPFWVTF